jgi:enoyl-CoA hydratase/carnithine racemase
LQLATVMESLDKDDKIGCIVLTGGTRAFAGKFD